MGKYLNTYGEPGNGGVSLIPPGCGGLLPSLLTLPSLNRHITSLRSWDDWQGLQGNSIYYNYVLSSKFPRTVVHYRPHPPLPDNGVAEKHGNDTTKDYLPKVLQRKAMAFLQNVTSTAPNSPFFLMIGTPR